MSEHPIQGLMRTAMENIKEMVDVNTIVGEPVETPDGQVIIPISKVGFGFAAGGSEFMNRLTNGASQSKNMTTPPDLNKQANLDSTMPFGGGSGGGVSISPVAFLVAGKNGIQLIPLDRSTHLWDRIIEAAPTWIDRITSMLPTNQNPSNQATITLPLQNQ